MSGKVFLSNDIEVIFLLSLKGITKKYYVGDTEVEALRGIDINFRESEFVAILGQSGCGKTTLLNIIGGLDRYTSGDLEINGISTKKYKDKDWDRYRNHSIGFVFQSYNLIPHQTVLANVELALTISGVSKTERRRRATEALKRVGLGDQIKKKPNQMSGGQVQRVAIARALVNDPDILLADEPTGALDTETSVAVMEILKEVAKDKLVIMVTHNPDLAEKYSTRTVRLLDGKIISDSQPFIPTEKDKTVAAERSAAEKKKGKRQMSFATATALSFNNLKTKKGRTILTSFAGSIGIIGIALIMAVSSGFKNYINTVQADTLSSYPLSITRESVDLSSMMASMMSGKSPSGEHPLDKIYSRDVLVEMMKTMSSGTRTSELSSFKKYLDSGESGIESYINGIQYGYGVTPKIYFKDSSGKLVRVSPGTVMENLYGSAYASMSAKSAQYSGMNSSIVWTEILDNRDFVKSQYDVLAGEWPESDDFTKLVFVVDKNNEVSDFVLYSLGLRDQSEIDDMKVKIMEHKPIESEQTTYTYDEILGLEYKLILDTDLWAYDENTNTWLDKSKDSDHLKSTVENGKTLTVACIVRPTQNASATSISGSVGYSSSLTKYIINSTNSSDIVKAQFSDKNTDIFTGLPFETGEKKKLTMEDVNAYILTLPEAEQAQMKAYIASMDEESVLKLFEEKLSAKTSAATYDGNLEKLGVKDIENPEVINIYPVDFEAKDNVKDVISAYNDKVKAAGENEKVISYSDYVGILLSSVTKIINTITYVLIAFVAISLVVSSIMIGIITYISVLERTKEIGILRSIGASKKDVSRVFNAETFIIGLISGAMGIGITLLILLPVNLILNSLTGIASIAALPPVGAAILIALSILLTVIAGLFPAKIASKKDPVIALRTE